MVRPCPVTSFCLLDTGRLHFAYAMPVVFLLLSVSRAASRQSPWSHAVPPRRTGTRSQKIEHLGTYPRSPWWVVCSSVQSIHPSIIPLLVKLVGCPGARPRKKPPISRQDPCPVLYYYVLSVLIAQRVHLEHVHDCQNANRLITMTRWPRLDGQPTSSSAVPHRRHHNHHPSICTGVRIHLASLL